MGPFCNNHNRTVLSRVQAVAILEAHKHAICGVFVISRINLKMSKGKGTELGVVCDLVLIVSNGCPTKTCAAPPMLPASSSFVVEEGRMSLRSRVTFVAISSNLS